MINLHMRVSHTSSLYRCGTLSANSDRTNDTNDTYFDISDFGNAQINELGNMFLVSLIWVSKI